METLQWTILKQKLKFPREGHVAFGIPDKFEFPILPFARIKNSE